MGGKCPIQEAIAQAHESEEDMTGFRVYLVFERADPNISNPVRWHEKVSFKTLRVKTSIHHVWRHCTLRYTSAAGHGGR
jgi:hypothetical protein